MKVQGMLSSIDLLKKEQSFRNCLIWGNNAELDDFDELVSSLYIPTIYSSPLFTSCGLDVQDEDFPNNLLDVNCTTDIAPDFVSTFDRNFHLKWE